MERKILRIEFLIKNGRMYTVRKKNEIQEKRQNDRIKLRGNERMTE